MKRALIFRLGAYGDILHLSFLPHLLKDKGYDKVDVETGIKGYRILVNNPFIDNLAIYPSELLTGNEKKAVSTRHALQKHLKIMSLEYDNIFFLGGTIESAILKMEEQPEYYMHQKYRDSFSKINYYDQTLLSAGFPEEQGKWQGEVYFTDEEHKAVEEYIDKYKDKFTVLINVAGTSAHKQFVQAEEVARKILDKHKDALIITTGSREHESKNLKWLDDKRVRTITGHQPFRQALLLAKHVNCVIGMESGLMVGANMWGTPTIQLMTAASLDNHPKYAKNDYSLQSPAYCSPCCKGPYQYIGCPVKDGHPLCVYFDTKKILKQVDKIYDRFHK
jgi:ADP-heptose:LPS heptosyltransferase